MGQTYLSAFAAILLCGCTAVAPESLSATRVRFDVSVDEPQIYVSKSFVGDGSAVDNCLMEVFFNSESLGQYSAPVTDGKASITVPLVAGRTYSAAFWAQKGQAYETSSLRSVGYGTGQYDVDDESMDAFCARSIDFTVTQDTLIRSVSLTRPFAMVSVSLSSGQLESVSFSAPGSYDVLGDTFGGVKSFYYTHSPFFLFAPASGSSVGFRINGKDIDNVPVKANYKTNLTVQ